ncbi:MAG TPA: YggT family protein [Vulgatibacter sp.]|nr:YggT family protein [Vulgatibacter sp.]
MSTQTALMLSGFLTLVYWIVIARVLLSWVVRDPSNPLVRLLGTLTDPLMKPLSGVMTFGGLDLSPMVVILGISFLKRLILKSAGLM